MICPQWLTYNDNSQIVFFRIDNVKLNHDSFLFVPADRGRDNQA